MNTIASFRQSIAETVRENTLNEANWRNESWKKPWESMNQDVLNDAFKQHGLIKEIFSSVGDIVQRMCKSMSRIEKKKTEQAPGRENYFKVVSDLVAGRIHCEVNDIPKKIDRIREIVLANNGVMHVRGSSEKRPYGFSVDTEGKFSDITQYVYVYLEKVGYPIEFQIGHEFASYTFTVDSAIRDNKNCGKVDLWTDNFYNDVKGYILDKANGIEPRISKSAIQAKADAIHHNNVPEALQTILNKL